MAKLKMKANEANKQARLAIVRIHDYRERMVEKKKADYESKRKRWGLFAFLLDAPEFESFTGAKWEDICEDIIRSAQLALRLDGSDADIWLEGEDLIALTVFRG